MTVLDKKWAINQLRHGRNSLIVSLAGMHMINSDLVHALSNKIVVIKDQGIIFSADPADRNGRRFELELKQLSNEFVNNNSNLQITLSEFWKFTRRNLLKESFETTLSYSVNAKCLPTLKAMPWFQFARTIRNCVSHDFHFRFRPDSLKILPITWSGKTIDASMQNSDMPNDILDPYITWSLHSEMLEFVLKN